jgi:hypothetical protein
MAGSLQLAKHRSWEDWLSIAFGVLILISPAAMFSVVPAPVLYNALACGVVLLGVTLFEIMNRERWEEALYFVVGVWLAVSVFLIDYGAASPLRIWHFALGALVAVLAAFEFWQDSTKQA